MGSPALYLDKVPLEASIPTTIGVGLICGIVCACLIPLIKKQLHKLAIKRRARQPLREDQQVEITTTREPIHQEHHEMMITTTNTHSNDHDTENHDSTTRMNSSQHPMNHHHSLVVSQSQQELNVVGMAGTNDSMPLLDHHQEGMAMKYASTEEEEEENPVTTVVSRDEFNQPNMETSLEEKIQYFETHEMPLETQKENSDIIYRGLMIFCGALTSFSHGANDVSNAVGK